MSFYKKILVTLLVLSSLFLFASCQKTEPESVDVRTSLTVDSSFKGTRTIVLTFPESVLSSGSDTDLSFDKIVQKYCPDTLTYSKNISDGKISYTFALDFASAHDYITKTTNIVGFQTVVSFSNPNTVMTKGWKLNESFHSTQLLGWIHTGAKQENFEGLDFTYEETTTSATLNGDTQTSEPTISVNTLSGSPVQKISITTINKGSVYDRTIIFNISQSTFDSISSSISNYFKEITDTTAASAEWLLENNSYLYTVKFNDISLQQLSGYTNKLLGSVYCEAAYEDKSVGSTPLASQNTYTETLDFSNYISNGGENVPVEYTYSVVGSNELGECQLYDGSSWSAATDLLSTNKYGSIAAIKSTDSLLNLKISDGKQYTASSISVSVTPLDEEILQKSVIFKYDIATGGIEACDYTQSYFSSLNIDVSQSVENDKKTCTVTFKGTPEEVNHRMEDIFGIGNRLTYSSYQQFMTLRTVEQFTDHVNFSSLIIGKNIDTPINYCLTTQNGDIIKSFAISDNDPDAPESYSANLVGENHNDINITLTSSTSGVTFDVSVPNVSEIIFFAVISSVIVIIAVIVLMLFRSKTKIADSLPSGSETPKLPESKNRLMKKRLKK